LISSDAVFFFEKMFSSCFICLGVFGNIYKYWFLL
jgi:hypothetical protein